MGNIVRVALGTFARFGLKVHVGADVESGVRAALVHLAHKLDAGRRPLDAPRFLPAAPTSLEAKCPLDLAIDPDTEARLEREALRQGITTDQLAAHAVMVYLAELEFLDAAMHGGVGTRL